MEEREATPDPQLSVGVATQRKREATPDPQLVYGIADGAVIEIMQRQPVPKQ